MKSVLMLSSDAEASASLLDELKRAGAHVAGATNCETLVQDCIRCKADMVVAFVPSLPAGFFEAASMLSGANPVVLVVFTDDMRVESMQRALDSGIDAWVVRGYHVERLRAVLQLAQLRSARDRRQRTEFERMTQRLEERKLVDRAKGILMGIGEMAEPEAFRALRDAAMNRKERVGQVAQRLIDAARNAEAINRAGQLRMLSQRLVKLHLLAALQVDPAGAAALRAASIARVVQNLDMLTALASAASFGDLLETTAAAWKDLDRALSGAGAPADAQSADAAAEALLAAAERLTAAIESANPGARMQVINLSGRQRMLSQKFAKLALLQRVAGESQRIGLAAELSGVAAEFERAIEELHRSPLTGGAGSDILTAAARSWFRLRNWDAVPPREQLVTIAQCSEELLEQFDRMTDDFERSLNVLLN